MGLLVEVIVDERNRVTLPKRVREELGIAEGSVLEVERKGGAVLFTPKVPVKRPTEALWGMAAGVLEESPKRVAREAVGKRLRLGR